MSQKENVFHFNHIDKSKTKEDRDTGDQRVV